MKKTDLKAMTGKELFNYYFFNTGKSELFELVPLLPLATGSMDRVYFILEEVVRQDKKLAAYYPAIDKNPPENSRLIGSIPDGVLYIQD